MTGHYKETFIPPGVATRHVLGPILFKCCRVKYNEQTDRLEMEKGEYAGKNARGGSRIDEFGTDDDPECYETLMDLDTDETDLPG